LKLHVLRFNQDDPKKCTAAKMVKFKIASDVRNTNKKNLVLDPFSEKMIQKNAPQLKW
jgi:pre-rRNA-processing protein TSR3